jgi:dihydroorotate dehydrogenase (fumarate)
LFEEQIERQDEELFSTHDGDRDTEEDLPGYISELSDYNSGPDSYLKLVENAKRCLQIPIIASLNATHSGAWARYAKLLVDAGADALELNVCFIPTNPKVTAQQVEDQLLQLVAIVRQQTIAPLAVKIGPFFSALPNLALRLVAAGADGLVLFNRFLEPEINVELRRIEPQLELSHQRESRLPLRWIAILRDQISTSLAATSGIHDATDIVKALMAGADVVMIASTLLRHGPDYLTRLRDDFVAWLQQHGYQSLTDLRGSMSMGHLPNPSALERVNYMKLIATFPKCYD